MNNNSSYFSFLICHHGNVVNVYYNGVPIGEIKEGHFHGHQFVRGGKKIPMRFEDLPDPCPIKSMANFKTVLSDIVASINLPEENSHAKNT